MESHFQRKSIFTRLKIKFAFAFDDPSAVILQTCRPGVPKSGVWTQSWVGMVNMWDYKQVMELVGSLRYRQEMSVPKHPSWRYETLWEI